MPDLPAIRAAISEISRHRNSVTAKEIRLIVEQLGACGFDVSHRPARHGRLYRVGKFAPFMVTEHNRGSRFVRRRYVENFLSAMVDAGLFEE